MPQITKDHALTICKKLKAVNESAKGAAHITYSVYHGKVLLGSFGVRHGSNRNQGHGHIPDDLNISPRLAWELGSCTKYLDDYLACMREKGMLPTESSPEEIKAVPELKRPWERNWLAIQEGEVQELAASDSASDSDSDSDSENSGE